MEGESGWAHRGGDRPVLPPRECRPDRRRRATGSGNLCHSSREKRSVCRDNITGGICVAPPQDVRSARGGRSKLPSRAASSAGDKTVKLGAIEMNIITKYVSRRWFLWKYVSRPSDFAITACGKGHQGGKSHPRLTAGARTATRSPRRSLALRGRLCPARHHDECVVLICDVLGSRSLIPSFPSPPL